MTAPNALLGQTDPLRCGCEAGGGLASVDEALATAIAIAPAPGSAETVALGQATGRVLASAVASPVPLPPFDNAAMDGYALALADLPGTGPWTLPLGGRLRAGDPPMALRTGTAHRILTGAPLPEGADCVVAQEQVRADGNRIVLFARPRPGDNIRRAGEDLARGAAILPAGCVVGAREAAALASVGLARVAVHPRVRVAVLATGSELVEPGQTPGPGQIWNANRHQLAAAIAQPHVAPVDAGALPDDPACLAEAFERASGRADLLVTTGGVSVGDEDHLRRLFAQAGGTIHLHGVAMKPGKPLTLGRLGPLVWLGLPGNPVAAFVAWELVGAPMLRAMAGMAPGAGTRKVVARLAHPVDSHAERCEIRPARLKGYDAQGAQVIDCHHGAVAHRVALLAQADGLAVIPAGAGRLGRGALVEFLPF